ncbi:hypothetical protein BN6_49180 [Saccharothrix espanaensis DSM 44229]|uniref:Uncharacterized protein n=1 Tax=Saccharothrix espanaensis (strain ATCC 51144 / DSM 44229 / JCM 9112 / NBRC 15066 / NRRL 15764) TaxID=1179773 RepID=K0K6J9_SACES|nr:hypothetical protein BN6_49180 [Saccharothrix espanaensis DSM 44229]
MLRRSRARTAVRRPVQRESYGVPHNGGGVGRGGDSGDLVIYLNDANSRQLNGIVSIGYGCGSSGCSTGLGWVDVWSIFNRFAINLNPS